MVDSECSMNVWLAEIERNFDEVFTVKDNIDVAAEVICKDLLEEAILEEVFYEHRNERLISVSEQHIAEEELKEFEIHEGNDGFVFSEQFDVDSLNTLCLRCPRRYITEKFTTHFQVCFGKGRNSSRVAKLKIANNFKNAYAEVSDEEWKATPTKPKRRKIADKKKGQSKVKRGKPKNKKK